MSGISPLGWIHTLGSLPAIPLAIHMFIRHGRIVPRSTPGLLYLASMLIGGFTVFLVAHQPVSKIVGVITIALLLAGYGVGSINWLGRARNYLETIFLSLTAFFLMLPTVSETLRRVPDGHPFVTDLKSPILLGAQGAIAVVLVVGLSAQMIYLRRRGGNFA
ncbi:hypothetical protein PF66_06296 [Pseudomonas asplenii]|uniref:Transmembrane protein n=1 Tax=Pseudomonas asplenii TaxID=53407 RepID=A0A0M9GBS2_9PSED|nr:hypothetical protein [Pseudomonas fuscovaginae]KPA87213.1 hypothetical protein PF66_06296 [Pseudomonas fuscovaginae]